MTPTTAFTSPVPLTRILHTPVQSTSIRPPNATFKVRYGPRRHGHALVFSAQSLPSPAAQQAAPVPPGAENHRLTAGIRARTVVHVCASGTLCTSSTKHEGVPFGSHVDYVLDESGRPVFLLARNAAHTKNLTNQSRCSLFCQPLSSFGQEGCRTTLIGSVEKIPEDQLAEVKDAYIDIHAHAADALQYPDSFTFHRMNVDDVFFVGGYGVVSQWVEASEFASAEPDPIAFDAPDIMSSLNENKEADLKRLCKVFLDVPEPARVKMASLDRLGFDLRVRDQAGEIREYRVGFREVVSNRFDVQSALVKAFQEAWERENGYDETWEGEDTRPTALYYSPS